MNIKRPALEDLIWKGSLLPNKFKFAVRSEVRSELQDLDDRWSKARTTIKDHVDQMASVHSDWCDFGSALASFDEWITDKKASLDKEENLSCRSGVYLNPFLSSFKVCCL